MGAPEDAYERLQQAQQANAMLSDEQRAEMDRQAKREAERFRLKRRMWRPY